MALGTVRLLRKSGLKFTVSLYFVLLGEISCEHYFIPHSFVMSFTSIFPFSDAPHVEALSSQLFTGWGPFLLFKSITFESQIIKKERKYNK